MLNIICKHVVSDKKNERKLSLNNCIVTMPLFKLVY